ncbi:hypothetical protein [Nonomuraea rubra]|uniref:DUF1648 domain-containing protein n=1 Tax=Nonomuraea rubra TaxID=46180 RepID=A0A7X0NS15_9ACTN|nr:hypothetical protein [Nonomuraea rubra]MBB6548568.1 hypothetical protein [Nonomuraea rubra]
MRVTERRRGGVPWAGAVVSVLSLIAMVVISRAVYDSLPELVTTRQARPGTAEVRVTRTVLATAAPVALVVLVALMAGSGLVAERLRGLVPPALIGSPAAQARSTNVLLALLPPFLLVLHGGMLLRTAGHDFPLEVTVAVAFGLLIAGLGHALPRIHPLRFVPGAERAQRFGGHLMMAVGGCCAVAAFFLPPMFVSIAAALAAGAISLLMVLVPLARPHS